MLDGLHLHFERLRLFRGQNTLTVAEVVIRHGKDGFIVRHVADDTRHIRKSGEFACPLAAVACDDLIAAILSGTHQRGLIDARRLNRLHKSLHLRIVPDTKGMIFERVQVRQIDIDNLLRLGRAGSVTGSGGLLLFGSFSFFGRHLPLRGNGSLLAGSFLTLGHFVSGLLGLFSGSSLVRFGRTATLGLFRSLFLDGLFLRRCFLLCRSLILRGAEIQHLRSGSRLFLGLVFYRGSGLRFRYSLHHGGLWHTGNRLLRRRGRVLDRFRLFLLGSVTGLFGLRANVLFVVCHY